MSRKKENTKSSKAKIITFSVLGLIIALIGGVLIYGYTMFNKLDRVKTTDEEIGISQDVKDEIKEFNNHDKVTNIALFGIDAGDTDSGRSDSIMILTIDPVNKKLKISSIMRDSYVDIPGYGMDKINHAFAYGKSVLALQTINQNFGLAIDKFVATDFSNLPKIVDSVGGIDVNITAEEVSHIPGISSPGQYTLNGQQALAYSRIRYASGGDYQRTARQRTVMSAIFNKAINIPQSQWPSLLNEYLPYITTNMSATEMLSLGTDIINTGSTTLVDDRFPRDGYCEGQNINGIYYLTFDREETKNQIRDFIYN